MLADYFMGDYGERLTGFLNEPGITGMLETSDHEALDMVSRFIGAIVDPLSGLYLGSITKAFTPNADHLGFLHQREMRPE